MRPRLPSIVPLALLLLAGCPQDPPPVEETETDTGEPSCLDTDSPGADIVINFNADIEELALGECVPERIIITGGGVTDLTGLSSLREVGILEVRYTPNLQVLTGLQQLERIGTLIITGNGVLPNLPTFHSLAQVDNITITSNAALTDLGSFPVLSSVRKLEIASNPMLTDYSGFEALTSTTGAVELWDAALVSDLSGFEELKTIGGDLRIEVMPALESLEGLGVKNVGGDLRVVGNPSLSECLAADFAASVSVGGATIVNDNKSDLCD
ncbi:MAG: hypothetical protein R6X02_19125 [Enhygromyxa sp.]